ncbi:response regulator [Desulfobotulus sp. H1]|uniref:Response regulator n=1 Tax=Desulfobotulus pelophilus TaxID=2823377 RepID=A0ABT3NB11_9BACT|nr:response regulator [Desulfobotulus pelophilus]MCW7754157.1 response regulator [Desulfobotulus pelophilus]
MTPCVFFVDDEPRILQSLRRLFRNEGYTLHTFDSPLEALELVPDLRPAVVVVDQRMPRMTGLELLEEIRKISPATVRIMLTAYSDVDVVVGGLNSWTVNVFLKKPWDDEELRTEVRNAIRYHCHLTEGGSEACRGV